MKIKFIDLEILIASYIILLIPSMFLSKSLMQIIVSKYGSVKYECLLWVFLSIVMASLAEFVVIFLFNFKEFVLKKFILRKKS